MIFIGIYLVSAVVWLLSAPTACWLNDQRVPPFGFFLLVAVLPVLNTLAAFLSLLFLPLVASGYRT